MALFFTPCKILTKSDASGQTLVKHPVVLTPQDWYVYRKNSSKHPASFTRPEKTSKVE